MAHRYRRPSDPREAADRLLRASEETALELKRIREELQVQTRLLCDIRDTGPTTGAEKVVEVARRVLARGGIRL